MPFEFGLETGEIKFGDGFARQEKVASSFCRWPFDAVGFQFCADFSRDLFQLVEAHVLGLGHAVSPGAAKI